MNHLSNLEPPKAAVSFIGCEHDIQAHMDVVAAILKYHCQDPDANVKIYVNPSTEDVPLEWTLRHSSPRGILTLNVTQRCPGGAVHFSRS